MKSTTIFLLSTFSVIAAAPNAAAQLVLGQGTAVVEVITIPAGEPGEFIFSGVPSGSISAGETIEATGLVDGTRSTSMRDPRPGFELTAITCSDQASATPSVGNIVTRTAEFNIDNGETVTCVFTNTARRSISESSSGGAGSTADAPGGVNPFENPDPGLEKFELPGNLPDDAGSYRVPKGGPWVVQNFAGQMSCGGFNVPLRPDRDRGTLEVLDNGHTLVGTGFSQDTAPVTLYAVGGINGRYSGSAGGAQDGIPMVIDFFWQMITDEWIVGYLESTVSQQGMTCNMFRAYELEYAGD